MGATADDGAPTGAVLFGRAAAVAGGAAVGGGAAAGAGGIVGSGGGAAGAGSSGMGGEGGVAGAAPSGIGAAVTLWRAAVALFAATGFTGAAALSAADATVLGAFVPACAVAFDFFLGRGA